MARIAILKALFLVKPQTFCGFHTLVSILVRVAFHPHLGRRWEPTGVCHIHPQPFIHERMAFRRLLLKSRRRSSVWSQVKIDGTYQGWKCALITRGIHRWVIQPLLCVLDLRHGYIGEPPPFVCSPISVTGLRSISSVLRRIQHEPPSLQTRLMRQLSLPAINCIPLNENAVSKLVYHRGHGPLGN